MESVRTKTSSVSEYFCDERPDFINKVFEELWNFVEVFEKCIKVRRYQSFDTQLPSKVIQAYMYMYNYRVMCAMRILICIVFHTPFNLRISPFLF